MSSKARAYGRRIVAAALFVLCATGCREQAEQAPVAAPRERTEAQAAGVLVETPGLDFRLPPGWERRAPRSNMRLAEAVVDGPAGQAELAVFHFGAGKGGDVEANLRRWIEQMDTDPGTVPEQGKIEANGLRISWVDARGTLKPSSMGMGPKTEQPDWCLVGAVVEGPGGPWFFKATGPDATLGERRDELLEMLRGARVK